MGTFLRTTSTKRPLEPFLNVYELDTKEPCIRIGYDGVPWFLGFKPYEDESGSMKVSGSPVAELRTPQTLFADVPVMIKTAYGFLLAPKSEASPTTGPEDGDW
jgi:hypothetical protein